MYNTNNNTRGDYGIESGLVRDLQTFPWNNRSRDSILHYHLSVRGGEQQWCTLSVICVKRFVVVQDVLADNV